MVSIHKIGLRAKLSIIIALSVLAFSAVLTAATSNYLARIIDAEYERDAASLTSFLESNLGPADQPLPVRNLQFQIEAISAKNPDLKRLTVYAPVEGQGVIVVASSDRARIGMAAGSHDAEPITTGETLTIDNPAEESPEQTGENPQESTESGEEAGEDEAGHRELEMLSPLRDSSGKIVASSGVHLDMETRDNLIRSQQIDFAVITNLGLLALLAILYLTLNRMIVRPVKKITAATKYIGLPEWKAINGKRRRDELGDLGRAFNEVAESLQTRESEVRLLLDASVAVSSALDVNKILQVLADKIAGSGKVTYCRICLFDGPEEKLVIKAASPARHMSHWERGIGDSISLSEAVSHAQVLNSGLPKVLRKQGYGFEESISSEWEWALTEDTQSALLLPLISKDETIGVVTLGETRNWERTPFSASKIGFYQTLMNQAAVAIDNARLYEKTQRHVTELSVMHNMSQSFTSTLDYQEVISVVAQKVGNLIGAEFASVLLPDESEQHLRIVASYNLSAEYVWSINRKRRIAIGQGPIGNAYVTRRPRAVHNVMADPEYLLWKHVATAQGYNSLIALPLLAKGQSIGVICLYFKEAHILRDDEIDLLNTSANEAAIAIENARIYENLQNAFVGTIRSLAETIDAKDTYTHGHSEKVSLYAEAIARNMGIRGDELQTIRYAGYLHDVGKIGIPDAILSKPGKLSEEEFDVIKTHPVMSDKILTPVNFPFPVQPIVRHHHERYDGRGYPDGLQREEIPLGARILLVADAYEAMTSDRPYRKGLSSELALSELERNKVTQFDPRIVDVFTSIIQKKESPAFELGLGAEASRIA